MIVQRYTESMKSAWNDFVHNSKNATFLFDRNYMDYHADRFNDYSLVIFNKKKIIGLFPANLRNNSIYSHQGLSYGGVLTLPKTTFQDTAFIYVAILEFLKEAKFETIHLKLFPTFYTSQPSEEASYFMYLLQAKKSKCDVTLAINQRARIEFSTNKKRKIKSAKKNNLTIIKSENYKTFWNEILIPNLEKAHNIKPVHSIEEIELLQTKFPKEIILFLVLENHKTIAGTVMYLSNQVAHAQYISANNQGKKTDALDFLFDHLINKEYNDKNIFDFGVVNQKEGINYGLSYWKEGFGARTYCHNFYDVETSKSHLLKDILSS